MTLKKFADAIDGLFSETDWDHNIDEIEARLVSGLAAANNAKLKSHTAANEAAMLALSAAKEGHFSKRTDVKAYYLLTAADYTDIANWLFICYYDGVLTEANRPQTTDVADITARDALNATAKRGDTCRVASNVSTYKWNGSAWVFYGYYQIGSGQITGALPQSMITNLIADLGYLDGRIDAVEGGILQHRYTLNFGSLSGGVGTSDIRNIFPLGPLHTLHGCRVFTQNAFTSAGNTTFTSRVFYNGVDLLGSGSSMTSPSHRVSNTMLAGSVLGGDSVELEVTTDADITDWTAGKLVIWIYYSINDNS